MCIVKKISVLFMLISCGVAYPMKRFLEPDKKDQCITFKSLKGFPLTSLSKGSQWFSLLSAIDKRTVTKNIINHKDERLAALFNIATKLAFVPELKRVIAQCLYKDEQIHDFLHMPICQAYCYEGFLDIINDEKNAFFKECCFQNPHFKPAIICGLAKEITVLGEKHCTDSYSYNKRSELEVIAKVVEKFQGSFSEIDPAHYCWYEFYKSFPLKENLRYLPFFLSVFITLALPWLDICGVDEKNVEFNAIANNVNAEAMRAYQATGNCDCLSTRAHLRDEHSYCLSPFVYMKMLSWLSAYTPVLDLLKEVNFRSVLFGNETKRKDMVGFSAGVISWVMVNAIASRSAEQPIMGASYVTGLYFLICWVYHVAVTEKKYDFVSIDKLPALLQRRDIRII